MTHTKQLSVTDEDCAGFESGWSLHPAAMRRALSAVTYDQRLNVLEFGAGTSTDRLANLLETKDIPYRYVSYENDPSFASKHPKVETILYDTDAGWPTVLIDGVFDFVMVDGPHGFGRVRWYPLLRSQVRRCTILLIDDFEHTVDFGRALDESFGYQEVDYYGTGKIPSPGKCWKTVRIIEPRL